MIIKFTENNGESTKKMYPDDVRIIGEGTSFWGYTPFDRFVIPFQGKIEIYAN